MNIKQDFIPITNKNRPGTRITPTFITIHETANTSKGADAATHARYVKGVEAQARQVSWHFTVDDVQIIQHLPTNEMGWHAGTNGNRQSIGVELCVNSDGNFEVTKRNAQWLIKKLMNDLNIPLNRVVTHKHWTGKNCPATLLTTFEQFKQEVMSVSQSNAPSAWAQSAWDWAKKEGITDGTRPKDTITREEVIVMLHRYEQLKK